MRGTIRGALFASAVPFLLIGPTAMTTGPAWAQPAVNIGFDAFHDQLSAYGDWLYSDRWGEVWRPFQQDQDPNWRPYAIGYWAYTDEYGWTWVSNEGPWGDIVYHYGRWVYDPDDGWLWLTGYVWSPAWVVWRSAGPNLGWMPMPPDDAFLGVGGPSVNVSFGDWEDTAGFYGYARWYGPRFDQARFSALWTFVPTAHVADPVYRNYVVPRPQVVNIIRNSRNITNYTVVNNVIINKSVNVTVVQQARGGRPITPTHAAAVLHNTRWIAPVNKGVQVRARMLQTRPRGNGTVNSAPAPTQAQIKSLSNRPVPVRGAQGSNAPHHLFSQVNAAQIPSRRPNGAPPANGAARPPAGQPQRPATAPRPNTPAERPPRNNAMTPAPRSQNQPMQQLDRRARPPETRQSEQPPRANEAHPAPERPRSSTAPTERAPRPSRPESSARPQEPRPETPRPAAPSRPQSEHAAPHPAPHPAAKPERPPERRDSDNDQRDQH